MMRHFQTCFRLSLASIVLVFACVATGQTERLPQFSGSELPSAPHQKTPWELPVSAQQLPTNLVTATAALFEHGLADPRGCEYREVEIMVGSAWGGSGIVGTHAWVIPGNPGHYAVGWNGLIYPIISTGGLASLRDDILMTVKVDEEQRASWERERPESTFYRFRSAWPESQSLAFKSLLPLKASLLLRLGEVELAQRVWQAWTAGMRPGTNDDSVHLKDPYLMLVADWVWAQFDRAVTAHMRGDDQLALPSARALVPIQTVVEKEVARRGLNREYYELPELKQQPRYLTFLKPLSVLLADQERRAKECATEKTSRTLAVNAGLKSFPSKAARIAALIRDLDEVRAYQSDQPGGVDLAADPTVAALIAEGEEAVEPLLDVLENDKRLTRSVHFWRDFSSHRSILGAHEAAYVALARILKTSFFGVSSTGDDLTARGLDGRRAVVRKLRHYWKEYAEIPIEERWYRVLQDDGQSLDQWLQAASRIVELADVGELQGNVKITRRVTYPYRPGQVFTLRGEGLRQKTGPTVSQLLIRRMKDVIERKNEQWLTCLRGATGFALALAAWDGASHFDELREITRQLENMFAESSATGLDRRSYLVGSIVRLYLKRHEIADPTALTLYAKWLRTVKPEDAGDYATEFLFEPAKGHTDDPAISSALQAMFGNPVSAWFPLIQKDKRQSFHAAKLIETHLLNASAFREQVLEGLKDKSIVGVLRPRPTHPTGELDLVPENTYGSLLTRAPNRVSTVIKVKADDGNVARPLREISFRACDVFAWELSGVEGMPEFEVYWTEAARDDAIDAAIRFLRDHNGSFVFSPERFYKLHYAQDR